MSNKIRVNKVGSFSLLLGGLSLAMLAGCTVKADPFQGLGSFGGDASGGAGAVGGNAHAGTGGSSTGGTGTAGTENNAGSSGRENGGGTSSGGSAGSPAGGSSGETGGGENGGSAGSAAGGTNGGSAGSTAGGTNGGSAGSGGEVGGSGGSAGSSVGGTGGTGGTGPDPDPEYLPNGIWMIPIGLGAASNLQLTRSELVAVDNDKTNEHSLEWFGVFKNTGTTPVCAATVTAQFEDQNAQNLQSFSAYLLGAPYRLASGLGGEVGCIAPGGIGVAWDVVNLTAHIDVNLFASGGVKTVADTGYEDAVPDPQAPTLSSTSIVKDDAGNFVIQGQLTANESMHDVLLVGVTLDAKGMPLDTQLYDPGSAVKQGTQLKFQMEPFAPTAKPESFLFFPLYSDGLS